MAENLDDGEFWLPPQFLSDDDDADNLFTPTPFGAKFPSLQDDNVSEFPYGFPSSELCSPVDSTTSETESDEDDQLVAELTRRLNRSSLQPDSKSVGRFVSGSPQSTLSAFGSGKGSSHGGSPDGVCNFSATKNTWDLLHAAAGEVERMRLKQEGYGYGFNHHNGNFTPQRKSSPVTTLPSNNTPTTSNPDVGFKPQQQQQQHSLSPHQQLQIAQFQMLRQQQLAKQQNSVWNLQKQCGGVYSSQRQQQNQNRVRSNDGGRNVRPLGLSASAWPPLKQQYDSGMRAVFLGNPSGGRRRESAGTGVFLPRRVDSPDPRKKPACSTVLVPTRVAQALNLNLDDLTGTQPQQHLQRFNAPSNVENGAAVSRLRANYVLSQQKRNLKPQPALYHELRLPQEWTY